MEYKIMSLSELWEYGAPGYGAEFNKDNFVKVVDAISKVEKDFNMKFAAMDPSCSHFAFRYDEPTCNISLPKITEEMVEDFYPWLISDDGEGYKWNQAAVDFACLLKSKYLEK